MRAWRKIKQKYWSVRCAVTAEALKQFIGLMNFSGQKRAWRPWDQRQSLILFKMIIDWVKSKNRALLQFIKVCRHSHSHCMCISIWCPGNENCSNNPEVLLNCYRKPRQGGFKSCVASSRYTQWKYSNFKKAKNGNICDRTLSQL